MSTFAMPWLSAAIACTVIAGAAVARAPAPDRARGAASVVAGLMALLGLVAAAWVYGTGGSDRWADPLAIGWIGEARPLFALDALNAALLPFSAVLVLAVLLGSPREHLTPERAGAALFQLAASWALFCALDLGVMAAAWVLGLFPALPARSEGGSTRTTRRIYLAYLFGSAALLSAAIVAIVVVAAQAGIEAPASLVDLESAGIERLQPFAALPLLLVAIVVRKGAFPFQSWIPALSEQLGPTSLTLLNAPQVGAFVLVRVAIPLFPTAMGDALPIVGRVALLAAIYGAVLGLAARDLRRAFGWLAVSQSALVLVGLECIDVDGIAGGLTLWISVGLALTGLAIAIAAVEARRGRRTFDELGGLGIRAPWLGGAFLVLGLSAVGLPGTLGFVAEDLLVHGVLESFPGIGVAIVLATAANGFVVLRAYARTFYGPASARAVVTDAVPRERIALAGLAVLLVLFGLMPRPVITTRAAVAERLAATLSQSAEAPGEGASR
jgi:NADH:ubiquinone oxidoreductase subunit 4 (subunit M)